MVRCREGGGYNNRPDGGFQARVFLGWHPTGASERGYVKHQTRLETLGPHRKAGKLADWTQGQGGERKGRTVRASPESTIKFPTDSVDELPQNLAVQ